MRILDRLVSALKADLVGPMDAHEVIDTRPSRWYLTGFLVPNDTPLAERQDADVADNTACRTVIEDVAVWLRRMAALTHGRRDECRSAFHSVHWVLEDSVAAEGHLSDSDWSTTGACWDS